MKMIKSMTGYGSASGPSGKLDVTIEVKSVNNRYLDCSIRMPRIYSFAEDALKSKVQSYISRGKVDVFVTVDASKADDVKVSVNEPVLTGYINALNQMADKYGLENDMSVVSLSRLPDVLLVEKEEADSEAIIKDFCAILENALMSYNAMREREGEKLKADMSARLDEIKRLTDMAEVRSPKTVEEYRLKLLTRMQEVLEAKEIDESRILTEAAIFADRVAVNEEIVRLNSHIEQLRSMLNGDGPIGRKLDFLVQEFNREANTLGSKGNDLEMAKIVVDLKAEIEKIREQCQNVE